jgi:uncharacterized damage-inducible protein DinB
MGEQFEQVDLSAASFRKVHLNGARFRMVDLSGVVLRDVSLAAASIDGSELDGLRIDGVEIAPLVEAELDRRYPGRAWRRASDPAELRTAWDAIQDSWAAAYERAAALPAGSVDVSVDGEWSFARTLRHLVFATDAWLGAIQGEQRAFHPWGEPFSELAEFVAEPLTDPAANPSYAEVRELRADRVARVRDFLAEVSPQRLAEEVEGPLWEDGRKLSVLRCLRVILNEECEHLRFADRDLAVLEAGGTGATLVTPV